MASSSEFSGSFMRLMRRALIIFARSLGAAHPNTQTVRNNYTGLLTEMGHTSEQIHENLREIGQASGVSFGDPS